MRKSRTARESAARVHKKRTQKTGTSLSRSAHAKTPREIRQPQQLTSGTETSSLDPHANFELEPAGRPGSAAQKMDAGDLQSVPDIEDSTLESAAELADEGQDFEAELVEGIEDSAENIGKGRKPHELPISKVPKFKDRNRL